MRRSLVFPQLGFPLDMLRCESLLGLDQATCSRVLNKNYKLLVSMAPLSNEIRPISSCTPQVWLLEGEQRGYYVACWDVGSNIACVTVELCVCVLVNSSCVCACVLCLVVFALLLCVHTCVPRVICDWACTLCGRSACSCPQQQNYTKRETEEGREARLMSNSSAWPRSSFLAELGETGGRS